MPSRKSRQSQVIEGVFLLKEVATVRELYEALYGDPEGKTDRELSQRVGPALTRYANRTGNDVRPTGKHYHYTLVYA
jgi:hypothetical protein